MSSASSIASKALPLKYFIHRAKVFGLYRSLLRSAGKLEDTGMRREIKKQISDGFHANTALPPGQISVAIAEAESHLKTLLVMNQRAEIPQNSWLHMSTDDDVRGRVGVKWPWER
jgi:hypothetical protein